MIRILVVLMGLAFLTSPGRAQEEPAISDEFREKWTVDPANADPEWQAAVEHRKNGNVDAAIAFYEKVLAQSPKEVSILVSLGTAYWEKGQFSEAESWFRKAFELVPGQVKARQFLAKMLFDQGKFTAAKKEYDDLLALAYVPEDVASSARLNLGKLAMIRRKFSEADKLFLAAATSSEAGDRFSAEKGRMLSLRLRKTALWSKEQTPGLEIHFSPEIKEAVDPAERKAFAARAEQALRRMSSLLVITFEERLPVYIYKDEVDAFQVSGQDEIHTWKYSWWLAHSPWKGDLAHDLAHQVVARVSGSRPASKPFVEGLCCYLDNDSTDPHAVARALLKEGKLASVVKMHAEQSYELVRAREYGESLVAFLIDTYGMKAFLASFGWYNNVLLDRSWRVASTGQFRWKDALSEVLKRGIGDDVDTVESKWHTFLKK